MIPVLHFSAFEFIHFQITSLCSRFEMNRVHQVFVVGHTSNMKHIRNVIEASTNSRCVEFDTEWKYVSLQTLMPPLQHWLRRFVYIAGLKPEPEPRHLKMMSTIALSVFIETDFYMVMDTGTAVIRATRVADMFDDTARVIVNLHSVSAADTEQSWRESAEMTGTELHVKTQGLYPIHRDAVQSMREHLKELHDKDALEFLLDYDEEPWSFDALYFAFLSRYHAVEKVFHPIIGDGANEKVVQPYTMHLNSWQQVWEFYAPRWSSTTREMTQGGAYYSMLSAADDETNGNLRDVPNFVVAHAEEVLAKNTEKALFAEMLAFATSEMI